ncbi:MAG: GntR family transcriptional regulator [Firmicutes bacterium]|nr:GntR family transcriptional regulator [Bacillota bacterium]
MGFRLKGIKNIYEEIAEQYKSYIRAGVMRDGEKLPSCRELAIEMGINPNTVERAYAQLEQEGFVYTVPKKGVFVRFENQNTQSLARDARAQIAGFRAAGLTAKQLNQIVKEVFAEDIRKEERNDRD